MTQEHGEGQPRPLADMTFRVNKPMEEVYRDLRQAIAAANAEFGLEDTDVRLEETHNPDGSISMQVLFSDEAMERMRAASLAKNTPNRAERRRRSRRSD